MRCQKISSPILPGRIRTLRGWPSRLARRFLRDRRGATAVFLAIAIVPLVGFLGLAVDATRGYLVKARLNQALDAAGLAGGRVIFADTRDADIQMYFNANFPPGYMGATVTGPTVAVDANSEKLTLTADATLGTTFLRVLGIETMTVHSDIEVTRRTDMLDVVLSIDVSGSMLESAGGGVTKIQAVRDAATTLTNILFGDDETKALLKIGLVPWNAKVNVMTQGVAYTGSTATTVSTAFGVPNFKHPLTGATVTTVYKPNNSPVYLLNNPGTNEPFTDANGNGVYDVGETYTDTNGNARWDGWRGCVYARYRNSGFANNADVKDGIATHADGDWYAWEAILSPQGEPVSPGRCTAAPSGSECTPCYSRGVQPLVNVKATILSAISGLPNPNSDMYTNIQEGLAWGWRVLSPGYPFEQADPAPLYPRQQAIVLLTDGENTGMYGDAYKTIWGTSSTAKTNYNSRMQATAANIKATGVKIYVIQFGDANPATQAQLKLVASGENKPYFNYAPTTEQLHEVFQEVANDLSKLRLSK